MVQPLASGFPMCVHHPAVTVSSAVDVDCCRWLCERASVPEVAIARVARAERIGLVRTDPSTLVRTHGILDIHMDRTHFHRRSRNHSRSRSRDHSHCRTSLVTCPSRTSIVVGNNAAAAAAVAPSHAGCDCCTSQEELYSASCVVVLVVDDMPDEDGGVALATATATALATAVETSIERQVEVVEDPHGYGDLGHQTRDNRTVYS